MTKKTLKQPDESLPSTEHSLPFLLVRAREAVMPPIRAMLLDSGLTEQQWRILRVLQENGPLDATNLAFKTGLLAPSVTRIVQTMTEKELVSRIADENDRRRQVIHLLPEGLGILERNLEEAVGITEGFREVLGKKDYEQLVKLLVKLIP